MNPDAPVTKYRMFVTVRWCTAWVLTAIKKGEIGPARMRQMASREPMSSVDTAWLRMERRTNPMMIVAVIGLDRRVSLDRLNQTIAAGMLRHRRFRQRVVEEVSGIYWDEDTDFELEFHVKRVALPAPAGTRELQDMVSDLASTPLDRAHPLWQFHLVEHCNGGSALIARIHHCYADGVALVRVLLSMADGQSAAGPFSSEAPEAQAGWLAGIGGIATNAIKIGTGLLGGTLDLVTHPTRALDVSQQGAALVGEAARLALMPNDSMTRFKGVPRGAKRAAWSERLPLDAMKAIAHALDCSVNDVILSCVAGALQAYLLSKGDAVKEVELRALVPVNLRPANDQTTLGNYFGLVALLLPLYIDNPLKRIYLIKERMRELKSSQQAGIVLALLGTAGMVPKLVQEEILDSLANRASAVMTNLPGPQVPIHLAGARVTEIMFWVPQSGNIGMGISVLSYDGGVQFGALTDKALVADPQHIAGSFAEQFDQLMLIALLLGPWQEPPDPASVEETLRKFA
jgi:diacylglycerol O-acyltransferase / wax synthase